MGHRIVVTRALTHARTCMQAGMKEPGGAQQLYSYDLYSYSHGLYSYGLYSYGLYIVMAYI